MNIRELLDKIRNFVNSLPGIFTFSRKELMIIVSSAGVIILAAIIVCIISISAGPKEKRPDAEESESSYEFDYSVQDKKLYLSDFIVDDRAVEDAFNGVIFSREENHVWTEEEIQEYWIDPKEIAGEQLEEESERIIMDIFKDVP